jgi:diguanylate cyclase (GGDEF)-like protein
VRRRSARRRCASTPIGVRAEWWLQAATSVLVISYGISCVAVRSPHHYRTLWEGWVYTTAECLPILPALLAARRSEGTRWAWSATALAIFLNAAGDIVYTYHDRNLVPVPSIGASGILYIATAAVTVVAVALFSQSCFGRAHLSVRLDGLIVGLTVASVAGVLWFGPVLRESGKPIAVGIEVSYPLVDLVILCLVVAALASGGYRPDLPIGLVLSGILFLLAANTASLYQHTASTYHDSSPLHEAYLIGLLLVGLGATTWQRRSGPRQLSAVPSPRLAMLPVAAGLVSLSVVITCLLHRGPAAVPFLAASALALAMARMWMTLKELHSLTAAHYLEARSDQLTGLNNRRALLEQLTTALASQRDSGGQVGLLLADLDGFKHVNDTFGHKAGDDLLCLIARRLEGATRGRAFLARLGGDEFALQSARATQHELVSLSNDITGALSQPFEVHGACVHVGMSIGLAMSDGDAGTARELLRRADIAMYDAKRARLGLCIYGPKAAPGERGHPGTGTAKHEEPRTPLRLPEGHEGATHQVPGRIS